MAYEAVTVLLENVRRLLQCSHVDLISAAEDELRKLNVELETLKAFLEDTFISRLIVMREEGLREMARHITQFVFYAEDTIESCLIQTSAAKATNIFRRRLNRKLYGRSLAKAICSIREDRLKPTIDRFAITSQQKKISDRSDINLEKQHTEEREFPAIRLDNIVGFEDEAETLINYLMEEMEELDVISITGMPGIGKTTLARKIYQSEKIQEEFPTRIWVDIPQVFNKKDFYLNILKELTKQEKDYSLSDDDLADEIFEFLENRKFLLVVEDVWTVKAWHVIQSVLPESNKTSKILLTSRNIHVCKYASDTRVPHKLRLLNETESWELLQLQVFGNLHACPQWLKSIGKCVAKKCDGLPLAIEVIGSSLLVACSTEAAKHLTLRWWNNVSENVTMYVIDHGQHHVFGTLELSYNKLPESLRYCFLYLGMFPEDYEILVWTLTCLWIAEGFIQQKEGQSLEQTAEEYLEELISNNLVMVDKKYHSGQAKTCRVHKVIHGFCKFKATKQNFFQEIKMLKEGVFDPPVSLTPNYRRLCIYSHLSEFLSREPNGSLVRSFLCFHKEPILLDPKYISAINKFFNLLRVLELKTTKVTRFPVKLTKLMHLRYITLSCDDLNVLPEAISELWNLQILVVETQSPSLVIKANVWRMIQLRHLMTKAAITLARQEKREADESLQTLNLQTLSRLSPKHCTKDVFQKASNLKRLGIRGRLATLLDAESFRILDHLEKLNIVNDLPYESACDSQLLHLFQLDNFPPQLRRLTLSATYLDWEHMSLLGKIDTLAELKLKNNAFTGDSWNTDADDFRHLELLFIGTADLVLWQAADNCFPKLGILVLKNCEKLKEIPLCLAKSLRTLEIEHVPEAAVDSAMKIEEEKVRMQEQGKGGWGEFKLTLGSGCECSPTDQAQH